MAEKIMWGIALRTVFAMAVADACVQLVKIIYIKLKRGDKNAKG